MTDGTKLVGLIGRPVAESLSPRMQNAAFADRGLDWLYVPLEVDPDELEETVARLGERGFVGANVTIPHKTRVLDFCDELDDVAERAGSVNVLIVQDGRVVGASTDGEAVAGAIEPRGTHALVLGAGGAAQAVAAALIDAGVATLTVAARRVEQAQALAGYLGEVEVADGWPPDARAFDLVVNCTPVRDEELVALGPAQSLVDLPYRADGAPTALVAAARAAGCKTILDGLEVLVRQGAASFERWTGMEAPVEVMRRALAAK